MGKLALHYCGKNADLEILKSTVSQARLNSMLMFEQNPKFWPGIHSIDADFFLLMLDEKSNELKLAETDEIIKRYKEQFARYGTANFIDSAKSQFDFYLRFITDRDIRLILKRVKDGLAGGIVKVLPGVRR
jgi:hypothetical protein